MKTSLILYLAVSGFLATGTLVSANCPDAPGVTYIIKESGDTGYYKVGGSSDSAAARIKALQTGNPRELLEDSEFVVQSCSKAEARARIAAADSPGTTRVEINGRKTEWFYVTNYDEFYNAVRLAANPPRHRGPAQPPGHRGQEVNMRQKMVLSLRELLKKLLD